MKIQSAVSRVSLLSAWLLSLAATVVGIVLLATWTVTPWCQVANQDGVEAATSGAPVEVWPVGLALTCVGLFLLVGLLACHGYTGGWGLTSFATVTTDVQPDDHTVFPAVDGFSESQESPQSAPLRQFEIPMSVWHTVNATMDNVASIERVGGDPVVEAHAMRIMEAGWAAASSHQDANGNAGWPLDDHRLSLDLSVSDEAFIAGKLAEASVYTRQLLASPDLPSSARTEQSTSLNFLIQALGIWTTAEIG